MNRIFLSWDKPVCRAVAERLLSLGNDLHRHLVLVPTRESGRQLREFLASISHTQAIFAPQVSGRPVPPDGRKGRNGIRSGRTGRVSWPWGTLPTAFTPACFHTPCRRIFQHGGNGRQPAKPEARHGEPGRFLHHGPPCQFGQETNDGRTWKGWKNNARNNWKAGSLKTEPP